MRTILKKVKKSLPEYKRIKRLYNTAFPADERSPFSLLMLRSGGNGCDFRAVYCDEKWVGLVYTVSYDELTYIFYLAIDPDERGKGAGSRTLRAVKRLYEGQKLFLAIEELDESSDNYEERIRRRDFYEKNGFSLIDCKLREASVVYDVMSTGGTVSPEKYKRMMNRFTGKILSRLVRMEIIPQGEVKN